LDRLYGALDLINLDGSDLILIRLKTKRTDPSDLDLMVENKSLTGGEVVALEFDNGLFR
jgi:hypothetical protein